jgi:hypothetical protein
VLFMLKILFTFVTKQVILMRRSTVLSLALQLVFTGWGITCTSSLDMGLTSAEGQNLKSFK